MDTARLRERFSALRAQRGIYFDNAATSLTPDEVLSEVARYYQEYGVNVGRGAYKLAARLTVEVEEARESVAHFIGAAPEEIIFTASATDALNKLALSFPFKSKGRIITSLLEHHSNLLPWRRAALSHDLDLDVIPVTSGGEIDVSAFCKSLGSDCRLVAISAASNVLGTVQPVKELTELAHDEGALVMLDAAQWVGHKPFDIKKIGCDFCAFSAHKMCGPTGIGVLYVRKNIQYLLSPALLGGGTVRDVDETDVALKDFPHSFEPGTPNIAGILGFAQAVRLLSEIGLAEIERAVRQLHVLLYNSLAERKQVKLYASDECENVGITSFNIKGLTPHRAASLYDQLGGIMLRSGFHCALPLVRSLGAQKGTLRASLAFYNTEDEVQRFLDVTDEILAGL